MSDIYDPDLLLKACNSMLAAKHDPAKCCTICRSEIERLRSRVADIECSDGCVPMATIDAAQAEIERLRKLHDDHCSMGCELGGRP